MARLLWIEELFICKFFSRAQSTITFSNFAPSFVRIWRTQMVVFVKKYSFIEKIHPYDVSPIERRISHFRARLLGIVLRYFSSAVFFLKRSSILLNYILYFLLRQRREVELVCVNNVWSVSYPWNGASRVDTKTTFARMHLSSQARRKNSSQRVKNVFEQ